MKSIVKHPLRMTALAAAVATAFGQAQAQDAADLKELTKPGSEISAGVGYVDENNQRFGEFSGLNEDGTYLLFDARIRQRDDATGTWLKFDARNLGLDSRSARFEHERQGNWGYFIDFDARPRFTPYTINTGLGGIGTTTQTVDTTGVTAPRVAVHLKTEREKVAVGFNKYLLEGMNLKVSFASETKDGARPFGVYSFGPSFLAEPIDSTTNQVNAILSYATERYELSGGYSGSTYDNKNQRIDLIPPGSFNPSFMSLPPDNEAHKLHLSGGYAFSKATRGTFKVAYTRATQNEAFFAPTLSGNSSLDGEVNTTLAQLGLSTRATSRLTVRAKLRYEDRDDKTPRLQYLSSTNTVRDGFNNPRSVRSTDASVDANYTLGPGYRLNGGLELDKRERNAPNARSVPYRTSTDEWRARIGVRRGLSETLNGSISYVHAERDGSAILPDTYTAGTSGSNVVIPIHWSDRKQDKVRMTLDWIATDELSVNFAVEGRKEKYPSFGTYIEGLHDGTSKLYSVDASYALSDAWQFSVWASRLDGEISTGSGRAATTFESELRTVGDAIGFGVTGKPMARVKVGADFSYLDDQNEYRLSGGGAPATPIPDYYYKTTSLKVYGKYELTRTSGVRVDYAYYRSKTNDWTWANWAYPDGTTFSQGPLEKVNFVGVSYLSRF